MGIRVYGEVNKIGLVDNYINTAYDTVKIVSDNIANVISVSNSITGVSTVASNIASVNLVNLDLVKGKGTNTNTDSAILNCLDNATAVANSVASVSATVDALNSLYNANDVLAKLLTVDGTGSGLDADLLDGQSSAYYRNFNNLTNRPSTYTPTTLNVQNILGNMVSGNTELGIAVTYNTTSKKLDFNVSDPTITLTGDLTGAVTLTNLGSASLLATVKDNSHAHTIANVTGLQASLNSKEPLLSANTILTRIKTVDGAGSGLDADLLDGNSSTYFAKAADVSVNTTHRNSTSNPHGVTKAQVGLSLVPNHNFTSEVNANTAKVSDINHVNIQLPNVDNTSDVNKPVSIATQNQLNTKLDVLSDVLKTIIATAKEVYIYDTSKDTIDWRHNENTSWYNEPLNTATRGATREFPAVVLIVATDTEFTIYDATNPLLPMWSIVYAVNRWTQGTYHVVSPTIAKISAENGVICVARGSSVIGTDCFDFVNDSITMFYTSVWGGESGVNIAGRNGTTYYKQNSPTGFIGIVGAAKSLLVTHDKLGNTLIYIGSTGGLVRIEGTSSYSPTSVWVGGSQPTVVYVSSLARNGDNILIAIDNSYYGKHISSYSVDAKLNNTFDYLTHREYVLDVALWNLSLTPLAINGVISRVKAINTNVIATNNQLILTKPNPSSFGLGLHATITSSFNSGYQYGDIKGVWLADTVAGTVTGGTVADRSYNNSSLTINGTLTKTAVNTGCELVGYSGFSSTNYLSHPHDARFDFGTGDFNLSIWFSNANSGTTVNNRMINYWQSDLLNLGNKIDILKQGSSSSIYIGIGTTSIILPIALTDTSYRKLNVIRKAGVLYGYIDNQLLAQVACTDSVGTATFSLVVGVEVNLTQPWSGDLALFHIGAGAPTPEQIAHAYNQEKHLFNKNTTCTLAGTSDDCVDVDYDSAKDLHHVATTTNKSVFKGLVRVSSKVGAFTTVSAQNDYVAEG